MLDARPPGDGAIALALEGVTKVFGGLAAVSDVTLRVPARERHAVIGPNGAGKTTLFSLVSGEQPVTKGRVRLFGEDVTTLSPPQRVGRGLRRTYQVTNVFPALTVEENVFLAGMGLLPAKFEMLRPRPRRGALAERVEQVLAQVALRDRGRMPARELSHGEQRQLELALALVGSPRVLLLDEPAAGLSAAERAHMAELVHGLPVDLTLVIIEHDLDLVLALVDRVTCLHNGRVIAEESPRTIRHNETVQQVYLGVG